MRLLDRVVAQIRAFPALVFVAAAFALFALLLPLTDSPSELERVYGLGVKKEWTDLAARARSREEMIAAVKMSLKRDFDINWLVEGHSFMNVEVSDGEARPISPNWTFSASVRYERLVAAAVLFILIIGSLWFVSKNLAGPHFSLPLQRERSQDRTQQMGFEMPDVDGTTEGALRVEMKNSWLTAQRSYNGSLYLLVAGVLMAFVGIGAFIGTVPDFATFLNNETLKGHWEAYVLAPM